MDINLPKSSYRTSPYDNIRTDVCKSKVFAEFCADCRTEKVDFSGKNEITEIEEKFIKLKSEQGFIEKIWDGIKNKINHKNSSKSVEKTLAEYKNGKISEQEVKNKIKDYIGSQTKSLDFASDVGATFIGGAAFSFAVSALTLTCPQALAVAALSGGLFKCITKFIDAKTGGRKYKTAPYDLVTGAVNGLLSPIVNGIGNVSAKKFSSSIGVKSVPKIIKEITASSKSIENIVLYPKPKLQGSIPKIALSKIFGKSLKGITKLGLAFGLREITFKAFGQDNIYKDILIESSILSPEISDKLSHTEIDFSNEIFDTKIKSAANTAKIS